jgi:hypothetical protein
MSKQPNTQPQPNKILTEPATVEACNRDFKAGTADRRDSEKRDANPRQGRRS